MHLFKTLIAALISVLILGLTSCSTTQQQLLFKDSQANSNTTTNSNQNNEGSGTSDYKIKSQDILQIRNLQNIKYIVDETPTTTVSGSTTTSQGQSYQVEDDGSVALPVLGHVQVAGLTRAEAAKQIEDYDGHAGPLYIILPDSYGGPKEKFILKSFPDYKGWYGSMLSNKYVMYEAK